MNLTSPVFILQQLIRYPSLTPHDGGCFAFLREALTVLGFDCEQVKFHQAQTQDVENFYAKFVDKANNKKGPWPSLLFAGHVDVVPTGAESAWRFPPFAGQQADGHIFGRGAVDMKGGIACFIAALARLGQEKKPLNGAISLLLTADEEGPALNGSVKMLQWAHDKGEKWDAALLGEPSCAETLGDTIKIGRRGSLSAVLHIEGQQGHVAYPQRAANPLPFLLNLLQMLLAEPLDKGNKDFPPSNLELTGIDTGNNATNIIPAVTKAYFNIRFNNHWTVKSLKAMLKVKLDKAARAQDKAKDIHYRLEFMKNPSEAFITHHPDLVQGLSKAVSAITRQKPQLSTGGGTSDARFIKDYCPVVEFGLVGKTMHQINEAVALDDLEKCTQIYQNFLKIFFAVQ